MDLNYDKYLVSQLQKGDYEAFDDIYCKYHKAIYLNALKLTKDEDAALDILQEVFSTLWEKKSKIDLDQSVSGWLFVICFNLSIDYIRYKAKETKAFTNLSLITNNDRQEEYAELDQQQYCLMQDAISQLSPQRQRVLIMCKVEGKSYNETAKLLNLSRHTVKEYLSVGMLSIKNFIRKNASI